MEAQEPEPFLNMLCYGLFRWMKFRLTQLWKDTRTRDGINLVIIKYLFLIELERG